METRRRKIDIKDTVHYALRFSVKNCVTLLRMIWPILLLATGVFVLAFYSLDRTDTIGTVARYGVAIFSHSFGSLVVVTFLFFPAMLRLCLVAADIEPLPRTSLYYWRWGAAEGRGIVSAAIFFILFVALTLLSVLSFVGTFVGLCKLIGLSAMESPRTYQILVWLRTVGPFVLMGWFFVRFSLYVTHRAAMKKSSLTEAASLTKGHFWSIAVLLFCVVMFNWMMVGPVHAFGQFATLLQPFTSVAFSVVTTVFAGLVVLLFVYLLGMAIIGRIYVRLAPPAENAVPAVAEGQVPAGA